MYARQHDDEQEEQNGEDCFPITKKMWSNSLDYTREAHRLFGKCLQSDEAWCYCCLVGLGTGCMGPALGVAAWLVCCTLPPVGATICTPLTGMVDCGIFSGKKIATACKKEKDPSLNGPETQVMVDNNRQHLSQ